ncbi:outer membrane protein [Nitratifractor sp.]
MKKVLMSVAAAAAISSLAMAGGDIAPVAPAPVDNWSGFYIGAQAGYNWGDADVKGTGAYQGYTADSIDVDGGVAGIYAGYNWLLDNGFLFGIEGEWNYVDGDGSGTFVDNTGANTAYSAKVSQDWDASLRLRAGMVVNDNYLFYVTGGAAWAKVGLDVYNGGTKIASDSQTMAGWTIGAGIEMVLTENLHARLQYRYTDYGSDHFSDQRYTGKVDYNAHMVTLGLSYRF